MIKTIISNFVVGLLCLTLPLVAITGLTYFFVSMPYLGVPTVLILATYLAGMAINHGTK